MLRDYQITGEQQIRQAFRDGAHRVIYVAPCASGKTHLICDIARRSSDLGARTLILVHRRELLLQTSARLECRHGLVHPEYTPHPDRLVQVAMVQTLVHRLDQYPTFDLIIFDEAHHVKAATWDAVIQRYRTAHAVGFTASACRLDGRSLGDVFDSLVLGPSVEALTPEYLSPCRVYAPSLIDVTGVHRRGGDFIPAELEPRARTLTGDAIEHYRRYADGKPALVACVSVKHAEDVAAAFREVGYRAVCVHGKTPDAVRDRAVAELRTVEVHAIMYCDVFSEGVDVPAVVCGIMLRPTESTGMWIQQCGRILRRSPGKTEGIILDHAGNCLRHGLPNTDREWSLTQGLVKKPATDTIPVHICGKCFSAYLGPMCPYCGAKPEPRPREVSQRDGELLLMTGEERKTEERKADGFEALLEIEVRREYKPGWAIARFRTRGGKVTYAEYAATAKRRGYKPGWAWGAAKRAGVI